MDVFISPDVEAALARVAAETSSNPEDVLQDYVNNFNLFHNLLHRANAFLRKKGNLRDLRQAVKVLLQKEKI